MAQDGSYDYLYVVEWDDSVHDPPYIVMHGIKLNSDVNREVFEKFMTAEGFPLVGNINTRAGSVAAQYLFTYSTGRPGRFEELDLILDSFGTRQSVTTFRVVGIWRRAEEV
jgi:hypothetical protein